MQAPESPKIMPPRVVSGSKKYDHITPVLKERSSLAAHQEKD